MRWRKAVSFRQVQLADVTEMVGKMRKSLDSKRNTTKHHTTKHHTTKHHIDDIVDNIVIDNTARLYENFKETAKSKVFRTTDFGDFGYRRITNYGAPASAYLRLILETMCNVLHPRRCIINP